jgi:hypothetical protein
MKSKSESLRHAFVPLILGLLVACNATPRVSIKTDYDHSATFGKYHTYTLDAGSTGLSAPSQAALVDALRSSLSARGLKETSAGKANLYIVPTVYTREKLDVIPAQRGYTFYPSSYGPYGGWNTGRGTLAMNSDVLQYTEGTLVVDFVDSKTHKIVFRGLAQAIVGKTEKNVAAIQAAVNKIVAAYPG